MYDANQFKKAQFTCQVQLEKLYLALLEQQKLNTLLKQKIEELERKLAEVIIVSTG